MNKYSHLNLSVSKERAIIFVTQEYQAAKKKKKKTGNW